MAEHRDQKSMTAPAAATRTSTLAIVSLASGIAAWLLLPVLGAITAVITGHLAKKEIRRSAEMLGGNRMATVGLVLGYVQIAIVALALCSIVTLTLLGPSISDIFSGIIAGL